MDIIGPIIIFIVCVIIFSVCGWCCKRKREGTVYGYGPGNVTVTSQPVPQQQPYPIHGGPPSAGYEGYNTHPPLMPMPQPQPGYPPQSLGPYLPGGASYPQGPASVGAPYQHTAGYPPQPVFQNQPPPYDVAVSQPPNYPPVPQTEAYGKQAPYNPQYQN